MNPHTVGFIVYVIIGAIYAAIAAYDASLRKTTRTLYGTVTWLGWPIIAIAFGIAALAWQDRNSARWIPWAQVTSLPVYFVWHFFLFGGPK